MNHVETSVDFIILLLAGALVTGLVAQRVRIPYTVALLLASLPFHHPGPGEFGTQILFVFLPALIFEAAWNLDRHALVRMWKPIALLAIPGVLFTALFIGYGLLWLGLLPLREGILLGSIVAATDPIAVIATFRRLRVPTDLATLVEGESLFNDGAAVVLYAAMLASLAPQASFTPQSIALNAVVVTLGGAGLGVLGAVVAVFLLRTAEDVMLHVVASLVTAYGTYLAAEHFHLSGIFAVLAAGITLRAFDTLPRLQQAAQEIDRFWAVLAFFANSLVFLLLGLRIDAGRLSHEPRLLLASIALVIASRFILSYGLMRFMLPPERRTHWQHVITIAGMRGALSLALAVLLPETTPYRNVIIDAVFAIITATLIVQGLTIEPILRKLKL